MYVIMITVLNIHKLDVIMNYKFFRDIYGIYEASNDTAHASKTAIQKKYIIAVHKQILCNKVLLYD